MNVSGKLSWFAHFMKERTENVMKEYSMHYGKGEVKFSLDPALVLDELVINEFPALPDPAAAVLAAIRNPTWYACTAGYRQTRPDRGFYRQ